MGAFGNNYGSNYVTQLVIPNEGSTKRVRADLCVTTKDKKGLCV